MSTAVKTGSAFWGQRHQLAKVSVTLTVTAGAYSAGQNVGSLLELPNVVDQKGDEAWLWALELSDAAKQSAAMDILLFDDKPVNSTFTDNATLNLVAADLPLHIETVQLLSTSYSALSATAVAAARKLAIPLLLKNGTSLWASLVARGAPIYATAGDLILNAWILRQG